MKTRSVGPARTVACLVLALGCGGGGPPATRTIAATPHVVYESDDGARTAVAGLPPAGTKATAVWVPDSSAAGYRRIAVTPDARGAFSVPDVPAGTYFLELDTAEVRPDGPVLKSAQLFQLTTSAPDLSVVRGGRPDAHRPASPTPITLQLSGLEPWQSEDAILIASSSAGSYVRPFEPIGPAAAPELGATTYAGAFDWAPGMTVQFGSGLPEASRGDAVFVYQRSAVPVGSGPTLGLWRPMTRYARQTDVTLADGVPGTITAALVGVPQTGRAVANLKTTQFAALAAGVNPAAVLDPQLSGFSIQAQPHSVQFPDAPALFSSTSLGFLTPGDAIADADYGTLPYGQFLDPLWKEMRQVGYSYFVTATPPGAAAPALLAGDYVAQEDMAGAGAIAPVIGPVQAPLIEGADAFVNRTGVGLQPTLSWSPPALGSPTSYVVNIARLELGVPGEVAPGDMVSLRVAVRGATRLKVPPGFLQPGKVYAAFITARQAPWDTLDSAPLRVGVPFYSMDCVTGFFSP